MSFSTCALKTSKWRERHFEALARSAFVTDGAYRMVDHASERKPFFGVRRQLRPGCTVVQRLAVTLGALLCLGTIASADPLYWRLSWPNTAFENTSVEYSEIVFAGPGKDGISAVSGPTFISAGNETEVQDREPVIAVELEGETPRAYPIRYLLVHEIVNDVIGNTPVAVTYCPLCNSGVTFDRRIVQNGETTILSFGVSGMLRHNDMVMYDHQTESWWQQAIGTAILGTFNGTELTALPGWMESWAEFKTRNPDALVMEPPRGRGRYGINQYVGYDSANIPFGFRGDLPNNGVPALARVVRVGDRAWPVTRIADISELVEGGVRLTWHAGQASAVDTFTVAEGRDVGTIRVFDAETGENLVHDVIFAFAFHNFWPDGTWMLGP